MKTIWAIVSSLILLAGVSFGASHHEVVFSGVQYTKSTGNTVTSQVVNNRTLIENLALIPASDVHLYDVVVDDTTLEVDVINRATKQKQSTVLIVPQIVSASNGPGTEAYSSFTVNIYGGSNYTGNGLMVARYNAGGELIAAAFSVSAGLTQGTPQVFRATYATTHVLYNF